MDELEQAKLRNQLLVHESTQLHDNIQRNLNEMHKVIALAFPVLTGAFAFAIEGKIGKTPDSGFLYALFSVLASVLVVSFNNIWMQLGTFTRYKYAEVLPKLYALTGRDGANYGQYTVRGGVIRSMIGVVIVQSILLPTAVAATYRMWKDYSEVPFGIPAYISVFVAIITTFVSWVYAAEVVRAIQASGERKG